MSLDAEWLLKDSQRQRHCWRRLTPGVATECVGVGLLPHTPLPARAAIAPTASPLLHPFPAPHPQQESPKPAPRPLQPLLLRKDVGERQEEPLDSFPHLPPQGQPPSPSHSLILDEGVLVDGFNDVFEEDLGGQRVAVVHDGLPIRPVPAVHCRQADLSVTIQS